MRTANRVTLIFTEEEICEAVSEWVATHHKKYKVLSTPELVHHEPTTRDIPVEAEVAVEKVEEDDIYSEVELELEKEDKETESWALGTSREYGFLH